MIRLTMLPDDEVHVAMRALPRRHQTTKSAASSLPIRAGMLSAGLVDVFGGGRFGLNLLN
jgi:hypothetical protein